MSLVCRFCWRCVWESASESVDQTTESCLEFAYGSASVLWLLMSADVEFAADAGCVSFDAFDALFVGWYTDDDLRLKAYADSSWLIDPRCLVPVVLAVRVVSE